MFKNNKIVWLITTMLIILSSTIFITDVMCPATAKAVGDIIIDNTDNEFSTGGTWSSSTISSGYYGTDYYHDGTIDANSSSVWAKWTPTISTAGNYNIYVKWTSSSNRPAAVPLEIAYNGSTDNSKTVNQKKNGGTWMLLGTYYLSAGTGNYVKMYATDAGYTVADAVKFEYCENGFFTDLGVISDYNHHMPSIVAIDEDTITITAQLRYSDGINPDKGPSDIISITSTDQGETWEDMEYIFDCSEAEDDNICGYSSVLVLDGDVLRCIYSVGPVDWSVNELTVYQQSSSDGGQTWGSLITPTIVSSHSNCKPTNGGKGYEHTNGRLIIPGRKCLLYSDDHGSTWTATAEFAGTVETKTQPYYINGNMSLTAIVPWRTNNNSLGMNSRVRIADYYSLSNTNSNDYGTTSNLGFCRYDDDTLLMTVTRNSQLYIRISENEGLTWTNEVLIMATAPSVRYSDITVMDDGTIIVVYMENETSFTGANPFRMVKFDMDWLLSVS